MTARDYWKGEMAVPCFGRHRYEPARKGTVLRCVRCDHEQPVRLFGEGAA